MKYAFMSFSCPELTLDEMLALAKRLGYAGIEPRLCAKHQHGVEWAVDAAGRQAIRRKVADSGTAICCLATSCRYSDPATLAQQMEETRLAIDLAGDLGCPRLRIFGGAIPQPVSREEAIVRLGESLAALGSHAQERGVTLCLETHDAWTDPSHVAAVMQRVNHPAIGVNWDYWHPARTSGWPIQKAFDTLRPWIRHVHFHDGLLRKDQAVSRAIGTGELDSRLVLQLLQSIRYDGYLSGEWINWESHDIHLPRELAAMKRYEEELAAV